MKRFLPAVRRGLTWCLLLQKRVLKKAVFLVILALVPLLAAGLSLVAGESNGIFSAAVWWDPSDASSAAFGESILEQNSAIRTILCDSEEEARRMVEDGEADMAWLIPTGFDESLRHYVNGESDTIAVIVLEQEENVLMSMARERLYSYMFPKISFTLFRERVLALGVEPAPTEEELRELYQNTASATDLMRFVDVRGETVQVERFLLSPVRGILSLLIVEGGIAAAIFCAEDERAGVYQGLSKAKQIPAKLLSLLLPMADLSVVVILSLWLTGLLTDPINEILLHLLFLPAVGGFCLLLLALLRTPPRLALAAFLTVLFTLALTPVFLDVGFGQFSVCLPTYHYIRGVTIASSRPVMLLYALATHAMALILFAIPRRDG